MRREVLRTINDIRGKFGNSSIFLDPFANDCATKYAEFLLEQPHNEEMLAKLKEERLVVGEQQIIVGNAGLEEDTEPSDKYMSGEFMDAHGLLLELQQELGMLTDKNMTHVGIGFAANTHEVKVVELLSQKPVMLSQLGLSEDGGVSLHGNILNDQVGLYAARIVSSANLKKDLALVGPSGIVINKQTKQFSIQFKGPIENAFYNEEPRLMELYVRTNQVDKIKYGDEADKSERIKVEHLTLALRVPMEYFPDPRTVIEDEADRQRQERDLADRAKRAEEEKMIKVA